MSSAKWILEPTAETFAQVVLERSTQTPVVVDFWAPWCGPCRQLTPLLEQLAEEQAGRFLLAKVNTEEQPALASAFGVQSIPFVVAIRNQEIVDQFVGVLPEPSLRDWINGLLPSPAEELVQEGQSLMLADDLDAAEQRFRDALELAPDLAAPKIALAQVLYRQQRLEESQALVAELEARGYLEDEARQLKSQLEVATVAARTGGSDAARARHEADPEDPQLRLELAEALAAEGHWTNALDLCLPLVSHAPSEVSDQSKATILNILSLPGIDPDLASDYRRKLASALY